MKTIFQCILSVFVCLSALIACTNEEEFGNRTQSVTDGFIIEAISQDMLVQQVTTRSSIIKEKEESKINQLYLFFFDEAGNYLESDENDKLFKGYMAPGQSVTSVNIPTTAFTGDNAEKAAMATVYALANVVTEVVTDANNDGFPDNFPKEGKDGKTPKQLFDEYLYDPTNYTSYSRDDITKLPKEGMPMVGKADSIKLTEKGFLTLQLKALMARIDVNISINSDHTDATKQLPRLQMAEWGVYNMPMAIPFTEPEKGESKLDGKIRSMPKIQSNAVIYNHKEPLKLTFYMFENLQPTNGKNIDYPQGVSEDDKQRWKPQLANGDATYFKMHAYYTTYNGDPSLPVGQDNSTIEAEFTFYLGGNHTNDFKVGRNRHYQNNVTITGLTKVGNNPEHITFDARVNITSRGNAYHIAMLRERDHDAHFCVTPMDVYLFEDDQNPKMTVSIDDPDNHKWIRMEKVPATNMANGTLPDGWTENDHLIAFDEGTEKGYHAGHGKRKYFTYDLVTNTLADNTTCMVDVSRDRIYFYLDENLSTKERKANIVLTYTAENQKTPRVKTIEIVQHGLLPVTVPGDNDNPTQTIYVEAYEEYLQHYDPLNEYENDAIYDGLEWGVNGQDLGSPWYEEDKWCNVYYNGLEATLNIIEKSGQSEMNLNEKPESAAEYCYNKNKRNADGNVYNISSGGWFLPGIRQLEYTLTKYYNTYPEFQKHFYWSSAAGKERYWVVVWNYREDKNYARATKALEDPVDENGNGKIDHEEMYAKTDWNDFYTSENGTTGKTPRTGEKLRIRAAYIPPDGVTIE